MAKAQYIAFYITVCCIAFIISKIVISVLLYKRWKRKHLIHEEDDGLSGGKMVMFKSAKMQSLKSGELWKKTMKLSYKDIIGSGGYGTVYRLMLNESTAFAVKKLNRGTAERDRGFERELEAMGDIKHRNILTLHGYCTTPHYNLLIYELMPNGSLDTFLHGRTAETRILDWPSRYNIALGAARGIAYLHHDCIPHIIHRDIKPSNILLDQNMEAQVSDFGLATLMGPDKTHVSTLVAGTFGYLAPEYFDTGKATVKGDVYSFGVVLLEILTGRKPTDEEFYEEGTKLVTWTCLSSFLYGSRTGCLTGKRVPRLLVPSNVGLKTPDFTYIDILPGCVDDETWNLEQVKAVVEQKREEYVLDSSLKCSPADEINKVFRIAFMCLEPEPSKRPAMVDIVKMLEQAKSERAVEEHEYLRID
uniref:Protein kinase domain-containing protein n=1 Tax=Salix viminalis TaxID=40686 RepID=A0A6N2LRF1_SALVM